MRKAKVFRLSVDLADTFTSEEVMTLYAQTIDLGYDCFGFDDAFTHLLGVTPSAATQADALTLAERIRYPYWNTPDSKRPADRFKEIVEAGEAAGFWDAEFAADLIRQGPTPLIEGGRCAEP